MFKRHTFASSAALLVLIVGLLLPFNMAFAQVARAPKPAAHPQGVTPAFFSVSLSSSNYNPAVNQPYTLTATANQDVGPTPYSINIYYGSSLQASCGTGTTCSVTLSSSIAGASYTYQAQITDGTTVQAYSNTVTVTIQSVTATLRVTPSAAYIGQQIHLVGNRFGANEPIYVYADCTCHPVAYRGLTDPTGHFSIYGPVYQTYHGLHHLIAVGQYTGITASTPFTVR